MQFFRKEEEASDKKIGRLCFLTPWGGEALVFFALISG